MRPVRGKYLFKNELLWPLLNRIRIGAVSDHDVFALKSRLVPLYKVLSNDILHIYPTKREVNEHNVRMQRMISNDLHTFIASQYFSSNDIGVNEEVSNKYIPDDDRDAGGLPYCIQLSIGTRVMLFRNLNVEYGLVNGAIGEVTHIHTNETASNSFITVRLPHVSLPSCQIYLIM